jgi:hypothetical protein
MCFENRVQELPRFLGVTVGQQLHRALEVGEQHRDLLALAFESGLRGQDAFGEVLGGVGVRGCEPGLGLGIDAGGSSTLGTELGRAGKRRPAIPTRPGKRRAAFLAELGLRPILALAPETVHTQRLPIGSQLPATIKRHRTPAAAGAWRPRPSLCWYGSLDPTATRPPAPAAGCCCR